MSRQRSCVRVRVRTCAFLRLQVQWGQPSVYCSGNIGGVLDVVETNGVRRQVVLDNVPVGTCDCPHLYLRGVSRTCASRRQLWHSVST